MLYISAYCAFTVFILLVTAHHPTSLNTRFRYLKKSLKDCMFPVRIYTLNVFADFICFLTFIDQKVSILNFQCCLPIAEGNKILQLIL